MTKVIVRICRVYAPEIAALAALSIFALSSFGFVQDYTKPDSPLPNAPTASKSQVKSAEDLFLQLGAVGLDQSRVYHAREVSIDRGGFHITLEYGVIAFTADVAGRVTGAFFEGDGEILLAPPNQVERASMALQTGAAILEEKFITAYFRFNDDTFAELQPSLSPSDNAQEFVSQWNEAARNLAEGDALRLLMTFSQFLPLAGERTRAALMPNGLASSDDQFLHARMQGRTKGTFDVYFDSRAAEQVWAGQLRNVNGTNYYDVWAAFVLARKSQPSGATITPTGGDRASTIDIAEYKIRAEIKPPTTIDAETVLHLQVRQGGPRAVLFELARSLVIKTVEADGIPVEFIHNPAVEGTQLARRGNDLVAVVFPQPLHTGQQIKLRFVYGGEVLSEAGPGLLYVGARGTWYPNRGFAMSNFDLEFHYAPGWTLVATGKRTDAPQTDQTGFGAPGEEVSRWISERPIPVVGFNLGKYQRVGARAGDVTVETYATASVERGFPKPETTTVIPEPPGIIGGPAPPRIVVRPAPPSPAHNAQNVAAASAHAIEVFSRRFGPYPYSQLSLTQFPGNLSQGWPGLIFLSSLSFLTAEEKSNLHLGGVEKTLISAVISHETAHQWWGDLVTWDNYRDQWISEALANYSSLMLFEAEDPPQFRAVMDTYRNDLLQKNKAGVPLMEDGPVTLGMRLSCSQFPDGYQAISYGRGTWLLHMLRYMLKDAERRTEAREAGVIGDPLLAEPFLRDLRRIRDRYQGKAMTTREMLQVFEGDLPRSLWFEGRKSLDWFYQGWINGTAVPHFELRGLKYTEKAGATVVSGIILQKDAPKDLVTPVPFYASRAGKLIFLGRVFADGPETPFHLNAPAGTRRLVLDPTQTLLTRPR